MLSKDSLALGLKTEPYILDRNTLSQILPEQRTRLELIKVAPSY